MIRVDADTLEPRDLIFVGFLAIVVKNEILGPLRTQLTARALMDKSRIWSKTIRRNAQVPKLEGGSDAMVLDGARLRAIAIPDDEPEPDAPS